MLSVAKNVLSIRKVLSNTVGNDFNPNPIINLLSVYIITVIIIVVGVAVAQWLRYCATNRKATGSVPDGVIGIFQ